MIQVKILIGRYYASVSIHRKFYLGFWPWREYCNHICLRLGWLEFSVGDNTDR